MGDNNAEKIREIEDTIKELEGWTPGTFLNKDYGKEINAIESESMRDKIVDLLKNNVKLLKKERDDSDKLYLSEIVELEKPEFSRNTLILAPTGSGKTVFLENKLMKDIKGKILLLVSNTALKDSIRSHYKEKGDYRVKVMTYHAFGERIALSDDFAKQFDRILCDEIHSLPEYNEYGKHAGLIHAIKYLFQPHKEHDIFYFTATYENLEMLEKNQPGTLKHVKTIDYTSHPRIKKYIALSEYRINAIEQIRPHLEARIESFKYFGYKCFAYNRTISGQKRIEEIAREEGFTPICLWSINNTTEGNKLSDEQLRVRNHLLTYGEIPEPYNFLIINSAMQEGWNLKDKKVKLAIMNTTNKTQHIQALGRYRGDLDVLVYRVAREIPADILLNVPKEFIGVPLDSKLKDELCLKLRILNTAGRISKWGAVSKLIKKEGYTIKDSIKTENGKRTRVSTIMEKE